MTNASLSENWYPETMYEDADEAGLTSKIPFIMVPQNKDMPKLLFMFESRQTGEFEPGTDGEQLPIVDMLLHQYANMTQLKEGLSGDDYDKVRVCLGLEPLTSAVLAGKKITDKIRKNLES